MATIHSHPSVSRTARTMEGGFFVVTARATSAFQCAVNMFVSPAASSEGIGEPMSLCSMGLCEPSHSSGNMYPIHSLENHDACSSGFSRAVAYVEGATPMVDVVR